MIVFDLKCEHAHVFEAWFASTTAWEEQRDAGQVACPFCASSTVEKAAMAPNVAAKGNSRQVAPATVAAAMKELAAAQAAALKQSRWVGTAFATKARAMHDGEETQAPIHGQASLAEAKALIEDGVPVAPLPFPVVPPDALN